MPRNESSEIFKALQGAPPSPFHSLGKRVGSLGDGPGGAQDLIRAMQRGGNPYDPHPDAAPGLGGGRWGAVPPLHGAGGGGLLAGMPGALHEPLLQQQQPRLQPLEPVNLALAGAAGRAAALEERMLQMEQRLLTAERTGAEVRARVTLGGSRSQCDTSRPLPNTACVRHHVRRRRCARSTSRRSAWRRSPQT